MSEVISMGSLIGVPSQAYTLYSADGLAPALQSGQRGSGVLPVWVLAYEEGLGGVVVFKDLLGKEADEEIFIGFLEGSLYIADGDIRASRTHRQPNRIYSALGIHPAINSSETQGRYYICVQE